MADNMIRYNPLAIPDLTRAAQLAVQTQAGSNPLNIFGGLADATSQFIKDRQAEFDWQKALSDRQDEINAANQALEAPLLLSDPAFRAEYERRRALGTKGPEQANAFRQWIAEQVPWSGARTAFMNAINQALKDADASRKSAADTANAYAGAEASRANAAEARVRTNQLQLDLDTNRRIQNYLTAYDPAKHGPLNDYIRANPLIMAAKPEVGSALQTQEETQNKLQQTRNQQYLEDWYNGSGRQTTSNMVGEEGPLPNNLTEWDQVKRLYSQDISKGIEAARTFLGDKARRMSREDIEAFIRARNAETGYTGLDQTFAEQAKRKSEGLQTEFERSLEDAGLAAIKPGYSQNRHKKLYEANSGFIQRQATELLRNQGIINPSEQQIRLAEDTVINKMQSIAETKKLKNILDGNVSFEGNASMDTSGLDKILAGKLANYNKLKGQIDYFTTPGTAVDPKKIQELLDTAKEQAHRTGIPAREIFRQLYTDLINQEQKNQNYALSDNATNNILDQVAASFFGGPSSRFSLTGHNKRAQQAEQARQAEAALKRQRPDILASKGSPSTLARASDSTLEEIVNNPTPEEKKFGIDKKANDELARRRYPLTNNIENLESTLQEVFTKPNSNKSKQFMTQLKQATSGPLREQVLNYNREIRQRFNQLNRRQFDTLSNEERQELWFLQEQIKNIDKYISKWIPRENRYEAVRGKGLNPIQMGF